MYVRCVHMRCTGVYMSVCMRVYMEARGWCPVSFLVILCHTVRENLEPTEVVSPEEQLASRTPSPPIPECRLAAWLPHLPGLRKDAGI